MNSDPKYVRLANRLSRGIVADVEGSGWSISGLDVKPFPTTDGAARFVRKGIRDGKLEPCSKAEFDEVQSGEKALADTHQEAKVQAAAQEANAKLLDARGIGDDPVGDHEDDMEEYQRRLDENDDEDDAEEQVARTNPTRKLPPKSKKKSKAKASADAE